MPEAAPVLEIGVVLLAAALAGAVSRRFGLPAVVGYLAVGLLVGPFTPGYVADRHQIQVLADVGVVLLLFEVGIELDLRALRREPRGILLAVPLQVAIGTLAGALAFTSLGTGMLGAVTVGLANAGVGAVVFGVPVALAAFVAGLLLSIRPEAQEARREVLPFRDLFAVMFFVAIGTLVEPATVVSEAGVLGIVLLLVALKIVTTAALAAVFAVPARRAQLGVGLGQIGEFSFVVVGLGLAAGVVSSGQFSAVLAAAAITIAASAVGARLFPQAAPARSGQLG